MNVGIKTNMMQFLKDQYKSPLLRLKNINQERFLDYDNNTCEKMEV